MNRKQFLILLAAVAVLAAAGVAVVYSKRAEWKTADTRVGQKLFPDLKLADVAELEIREPGATLHLKKAGNAWQVSERADFAAQPDRVSELLVKVLELRIVQTEALPEGQRARLQLVEPANGADKSAGTRLELKDASGKSLAGMLLGKKVVPKSGDEAPAKTDAGSPAGRYVLVGADPNSVVLVSEPLAQADAKPESWLAKDLIRVERIRSITSAGADGKERFSVSRESEEAPWKFARGQGSLDGGKVLDMSSALVAINLADVVADPAKVDTGLDKAITVKVMTFDNLGFTLRFGNKTGDDRYYMNFSVAGDPPAARSPGKTESAEEKGKLDKAYEERRGALLEKLAREKSLERWTYVVAKSAVEALLRERAQLLTEKKKTDNKKG